MISESIMQFYRHAYFHSSRQIKGGGGKIFYIYGCLENFLKRQFINNPYIILGEIQSTDFWGKAIELSLSLAKKANFVACVNISLFFEICSTTTKNNNKANNKKSNLSQKK